MRVRVNIERIVVDKPLLASGGAERLRREVETAMADALAPSPHGRGGSTALPNEAPSRETGMGSRIAGAILAAAGEQGRMRR